jgi:tetratricopeptide (TPR) repeat protein
LVLTTRVAPRDLLLVQPARQATIPLDEGLESPYAENILRAMDRDGSVGLRDAPEELLAEARRRTRGYPRALEALYGILSADRHTTLQEVLDAAEHLLPENVVEALVGQAFERIDPTAQQVMQALAVYGRPVTPAAVDFLLQPYLPGVDSAPVLNRLVGMHFARKEGGQYYLHPVDRAYAFQSVPEGSESDRPERRLSEIERLLRSLNADRELPSEGEAPDSAPVWSRYALLHQGAEYFRRARKPRAEWQSIDDLAPQLAEFDLRCAGEEYVTAFDVVREITFDYLHLWGHYRLLVDLYERIQGRLDNRRSEGVCLSYLGIAYHSLGQVREAIGYYEEALAISREIGDRRGEGNALGNLGIAYYSLGQVREAIGYHEQALAISREIGDRRGEGRHLGNLGLAYADLGQVREAIRYHEQALAITREIGDRSSEGHNLGSLASALTDEEQYYDAIHSAMESVRISKEIGSPRMSSFYNFSLAQAHLYAGDLPAARAGVQAACQHDVPESNHYVQTLLGTVALRQRESDAAEQAFAAAVAHSDKLLARTAELYHALDAKGHALAGLALCGEGERVAEAVAAFRAARAITRAPGIVSRVLRLLDALAVVDAEGLLAPVRAAAAGEDEE